MSINSFTIVKAIVEELRGLAVEFGVPILSATQTTRSMNKQEIFNTVSSHLLNQKAKSTDSFGHCLYRGSNGLKCAVGCLISSEDYDPDMEGKDVIDLQNRYDLFKDEHIDLLSDLQFIHDELDPIQWESRLRKTANNHDLIWMG